jgi:sporulation protein YlmC with PRC-barrel domain
MMTGRIVHASLHLLDRQIVSKADGRLVAKVDDVEFDLDAPVPHLTALLTGPGALGRRLPGLVGRFVLAVYSRLHRDPVPDANRIPAARIVDITSAVVIDSTQGLHVDGFGQWVGDQIISRLPGSSHETQ